MFPDAARLRFALPEDLRSSSALVFVAAYIGEKWEILPSTLENNMVCTVIAGGGTFCPMRFADAGATDAPNITQTGTSATGAPTTAAQQQPLGLAALVGSLAVVLLWRRGSQK